MRTPLMVANWKMNHTVEESLQFLARLQKDLILSKKLEVVLCPPFTALHPLSIALSERPGIKLGAQNCHFESNGAYTGEISPTFLKELGCETVILGHSERRQLFGEKDEFINKKVHAVLAHDMNVILCVGETETERKNGETESRVLQQLTQGLQGIKAVSVSRITIAYEPVWAIGTGNNATSDQAQEVHEVIRSWFMKNYDSKVGESLRILYGGSVKPENIKEFMKEPGIDGALVGGASLSVDSFSQIVNYQEL